MITRHGLQYRCAPPDRRTVDGGETMFVRELLPRSMVARESNKGVRGAGLEYGVVADMGWWLESFAPGAFKGTADRTVMLASHDGLPLAAVESGTMVVYTDDEIALRYEANLDPANPVSAGVISGVDRGDITKSSIAFTVASYSNGAVSYEETPDGRLHYIFGEGSIERLWEISAVAFPAHESSDLRPRGEPTIETELGLTALKLDHRMRLAAARTRLL